MDSKTNLAGATVRAGLRNYVGLKARAALLAVATYALGVTPFGLGCGRPNAEELNVAEARQGLTAAFTVTPITWNIVGLDSNNVAVGPNTYPVGVRVGNTGDTTATDVSVSFAFTTANALINLSGPSTLTLPSLAAGASADVYFDAVVTRDAAAYGTSRGFDITVSAPGIPSVTMPIPGELYVERLISQGRNEILSITGPTTVNVGEVVTYALDAKTAPGGYDQLTTLLNFPNTLFEVLSTSATYTAPAGATNDKNYADACGWNNDPTSPTYRSCVGPEQYPGGKAGGTIQMTYVVRIIGGGTTSITGLIYDFSGSSFHYNTDFGVDVLAISANSANNSTTANPDTYATTQDTPLTIAAPGVLANDTDAEGNPLTAVLATEPTHGTLTLNADGSFTYTPNPGFTGTDSFTYRASDGTSTSAPATVTLSVVGPIDTFIESGPPATSASSSATFDFSSNKSPVTYECSLDDGAFTPCTDTVTFTGLDEGAHTLAVRARDSEGNVDPTPATHSWTVKLDDDGDTDNGDPNDGDTDDGDPNDGDSAQDDFARRVVGSGCSASGESGVPGALWLVLALLGLTLRGQRLAAQASRARRASPLFALGAVAMLAAAPSASAQQAIDVQQFKPAPGKDDVLGLHGPGVPGSLSWRAGLYLNYAHEPLVVINPANDALLQHLVKNQLGFDLVGAIGLGERFELGALLPLNLQRGEFNETATGNLEQTWKGGLGDLRLVPKALLLDGERLKLGLVLPMVLPTGGATALRGQKGLGVQPRLTAGYAFEGGTRLLANLGVNVRSREELLNLSVGNELSYGVGAAIPFQLQGKTLTGLATLSGALGLGATRGADGEEVPLELRAGLQYPFTKNLVATLGLGRGLTLGYGMPVFRVFTGVSWTAEEQPKPVVRPVDERAEPDTDRPSIPDTADKAPLEAKVINRVEETDEPADQGESKVKLEGKKLLLLKKVYFATNKDIVLDLSFPLLQQVASVLKANPQLMKVQIEGHTDDRGNDAFNLDLSQRRAGNVRKYLVEEAGIDPQRLIAVGFGETQPVDTNETAEGRENNRRVEFTILETAQ